MNDYIIVIGNYLEGIIEVYGPFRNHYDAQEYIDKHPVEQGSNYTIVEIIEAKYE